MLLIDTGSLTDTTPVLGPVGARHHLALRILFAKVCNTFNELDAALCARDGVRWAAAQEVLCELAMQLPDAMDRVAFTIDTLGEA